MPGTSIYITPSTDSVMHYSSAMYMDATSTHQVSRVPQRLKPSDNSLLCSTSNLFLQTMLILLHKPIQTLNQICKCAVSVSSVSCVPYFFTKMDLFTRFSHSGQNSNNYQIIPLFLLSFSTSMQKRVWCIWCV
jgi:hypothetical protein